MSENPVRKPSRETRAPPRAPRRRLALVPRTLPRQIVEILRAEIVAGQWAPGTRIPSGVLAERFGVSHIPIREVFKVLESEGFVALEPNRAAVVTAPSIEDTAGKLEVMDALETLAARLACERATDGQLAEIARLHERMEDSHRRGDAGRFHRLNLEVHRAIALASGNASLAAVYETMSRHVTRARALAHLGESLPEASLDQHRRLVRALLARKPAEATRAMMEHRGSVRRMLLKPGETR